MIFWFHVFYYWWICKIAITLINMKELILLRHGKAEPHENREKDFDRQLIEKGASIIRSTAQQALKEWGTPDLIVSSPALRAKESAEVFADEAGYLQEIMLFEELYAADTGDIADVIRELPLNTTQVVLTGHNPSLEEFAFLLLKQEITLTTGACIHFTLNIGRWKDFSITITPHNQKLIGP